METEIEVKINGKGMQVIENNLKHLEDQHSVVTVRYLINYIYKCDLNFFMRLIEIKTISYNFRFNYLLIFSVKVDCKIIFEKLNV